MDMNYAKALKILGLKENYTEAELKKNYKDLVKKYHPDISEEENAEEIIQEINAAKVFLDSYKKGEKPYEHYETPKTDNNNKTRTNTGYNNSDYNKTNYNNIDINQYKKAKTSELFKRIEFYHHNDVSVKNERIFEIIAEIKLKVGTIILKIHTASTKEEIDYSYKIILKLIEEYFLLLKKEFYKEYNINENDVQETLNEKCTLKEFYNQLETIKNKYSKDIQSMLKLNEEVSKYKYMAGYDEIEPAIENIKLITFNKIKKSNFKNTKSEIKQMNNEIRIAFQNYFKLKNRLQKLEVEVASLNSRLITEHFNNVKKNLGKVSIAETEKKLTELENYIKISKKSTTELTDKLKSIKNDILSAFNRPKNNNVEAKKRK